MSTTTILVAEKKDRKVPLISVTFSYALIALIVSTTPNEFLLDLAWISIGGGLLATFLTLVDPVNRFVKWLMPKLFGTPDSVSWALDAMHKMASLIKEKGVDLTPSTERIQQWAKDSYYSPYLSGIRAKIVSETYFGVGLVILAVGPFLPSLTELIIVDSLYTRILFIIAAIVIFVSLFFHFLELIEKAHIVAVFEMMITFGIKLTQFELCKNLLKAGNWSETRSWILRQLDLPFAPWHWITIEPKYGKMLDKIRELAKLWGLDRAETNEQKIRKELTKLSSDLKRIAYRTAEKIGVKKDEKELLELATDFFEKGIISRPFYEVIQILEQTKDWTISDRALLVIVRDLLLMGPRMKEELTKIAEKS